jgi:hypothetical protein
MDRSSRTIRMQVQNLKNGIRILLDPCVDHGYTNPGCQTTFRTVSLNIRGSSVQNLLYVIHGAPRSLRSPLDFWKICVAVFCRPTENENLQTGVIGLNIW